MTNIRTFVALAAILVTGCLIGNKANAQAPVVDGLTNCVRADNGRPVCVLVATGRFTFVSEEFLRRYQQSASQPSSSPPHNALASATINGSFGPTFKCDQARSSLGQVICSDAQLRQLDVAFAQAYYALRHAYPESTDRLREDAANFTQEVMQGCGLAGRSMVDQSLVRRSRSCVFQAYEQKRLQWVSMLQRLGRQAIMEEVRRPAREHFEVQLRLRELGFLHPTAEIDGIYGTATREAIAIAQRNAGLPIDGFLSDATRSAILRMPAQRSAPHIAQSPPQQSPLTQPPSGNQIAATVRPQENLPASPPPQPVSDHARIRAISGAGDPNDLLLVVNVAPAAPNATKDLDGNITFRVPRAETCRHTDISSDVVRAVTLERWFNRRGVTISSSGLAACHGRDIRQLDVAVVQRSQISSLEARFATSLIALAEANWIDVVILEAASDRRAADQARSQARAANEQSLMDGRAGAGYIIFESQASVACLLPGEAQRIWSQSADSRIEELHVDVGYRTQLRTISQPLNDAFIAARRGDCRLVVGEAGDLRRLRAAAQRDQLSHRVGTIWLAPIAEDPSRQASAAAQQRRTINANIRAIIDGGSPEDLLLLANVSPSAPNAARDLDDNIIFRAPRAELCRHVDVAGDVNWSLAIERWFSARRVSLNASQILACGGRDLRQSDAAILRRSDIETLEARMLDAAGVLADANHLDVVVLESFEERNRSIRARSDAREINQRNVESGAPGIGYLSFENNSDVACFLSAGNRSAWQRLTANRIQEVHLDLGARLTFKEAISDLNSSFIAARRGECRIIVGEAPDLARIATAAQRNQLRFAISALWLEVAPDPGAAPIAPRALGAARTASPFLSNLDASGEAADLLLLINVTPGAPNASVNLAGNVVFLTGSARLCVVPTLTMDVATEFALERWFSARRVLMPNVQRPSCGDQDFSTLDGILVRRGEIARLPGRLFNTIAHLGASRGVNVAIVFSEQDLRAEEGLRNTARVANERSVETGRAGAGVILFQNQGTTVCVAAQANQAALNRLVMSVSSTLMIELNQRIGLEISAQDIDTSYLAARRGACRAIVGSSSQLRPVISAATRDNLGFLISSVWFSADAIQQVQAEILAEQTASARRSEQLRQEAEAERQQVEQRERELGIDRARRTEALRRASRTRATAMLDHTRNAIREILERATVQELLDRNRARNFWAVSVFPQTADLISRMRSEGWEFHDLEAQVYEFGLSEWQGRKLATSVIQIEFRMRNPNAGRYQSVCVFLGYQADEEFNRVRSVDEGVCANEGQVRAERWLAGVRFESQWNASPQ